MLEILLIAAAAVLMYKVADADEQSPGLWCAVTLLFSIGSLFILPGWPFIRIGLAAFAAFAAMFIKKLVIDK